MNAGGCRGGRRGCGRGTEERGFRAHQAERETAETETGAAEELAARLKKFVLEERIHGFSFS
jgi:hypothetical protein